MTVKVEVLDDLQDLLDAEIEGTTGSDTPLAGIDWDHMFAMTTGEHIDVDTLSLGEVFDQCVYPGDPSGCAWVPPALWHRINAKYRQFEVKRAMAQHIMKHKTAFPLRPPKESRALDKFRALTNDPWDKFIAKPVNDGRPYQARVPYPSWTIDNTLAVIPGNSAYNAISNFFQWDNRMRCGGWRDPSPIDAWSTEENIYTLRWSFWSMHKDGPKNPMAWKMGFLLSATGIYLAAQFRPSAAKAMYGWMGAQNVLDPSCGWGDRLAGFFCTDTTKVYVGCDPNAATYQTYKDQCFAYEGWNPADNKWHVLNEFTVSNYPAFRSKGRKEVIIINGPFEDIDWDAVKAKYVPEGFDLVFTSPPYFGVERYAVGTPEAVNQSWSRYEKIDGWRDSFFFPMLRTAARLLKDGGVIAMNIADPMVKNGRNEVCEPMIVELAKEDMNFVGVVPMALARRPSSSVEGMGAIPPDRFSEPVWMFRKGTTETPGQALHDAKGQDLGSLEGIV